MKKLWNIIKGNILVVALLLSYTYLLWSNYIKTVELRELVKVNDALVEVYGFSKELYYVQTDTYFEALELIKSQRAYIDGLTGVIKEYNAK